MAKKPTKKPVRKKPAAEEPPIEEAPPLPEEADDEPDFITLGPDRDLSKKKKENLVNLARESGGHLWDVVVRGYEEAQRQRGSGPNNMLTDKLVVGIPMPSLVMEYLFGANIFPLQLVMQLVGEQHAGKSGLLAEIHRWFDAQGGGGYYNENESKHSPFWFQSIMGKEAYRRLRKNQCQSVEDWQENLVRDFADAKYAMDGTKEEPGIGRGVPVLFSVDSVMGKPSRRTHDKIAKEGSADLTRPIDANIITTWLRSHSHEMDQYPFSLVFTNHVKYRPNPDDPSEMERHKAGGSHLSFQETIELQVDRRRKLSCAEWEGREVMLTMFKNSLAPTVGYSAMARCLWWFEDDPETGKIQQKTVWDWHHATIGLLDYLMHGKEGQRTVFLKNRLKDINFHLACPKSSPVDNCAWSKDLGMDEKGALSWSEVGGMIYEDRALVKKLRKALGIFEYPYLTGDIREQLVTMTEEAT